MILQKDFPNKYLEDVYEGKIKQGLGLELPSFDHHYRFKQGEFTIINGLDNVGKTDWMLWYFTALSVKHGLKWCIWSGENRAEQLVKRIIQWLKGNYIKNMDLKTVYSQKEWVLNHFKFIDNTGFYKTKELFDYFNSVDVDGCLIDPFTGMDREFTHAANYKFLNESRKFVNSTKKSLYVNTHPNTEAARRVYSDSHEFAGYPMPPSRSQSEGGQPFANRPDNFITIHRLLGHPLHQYETQIFVRKVKDTETGGTPNSINEPVIFNFNKGLGFISDDINVLSRTKKDDMAITPLEINKNFDNEAPF